MADQADVQTKIDYFQKHALPILAGHLQARSTGLQIFTAIQGGLIVGWLSHPHWALAIVGLSSCLSFYLWDSRNRFVIGTVHQLGEEIVERSVFGVGEDGRAVLGLHKTLQGTMERSGRVIPGLRGGGFASRTWAIRVMLLSGVSIWITLIADSARWW